MARRAKRAQLCKQVLKGLPGFFLLLITRALTSAPAAWAVLDQSGGLIRAASISLPPTAEAGHDQSRGSRVGAAFPDPSAATLHLPFFSATQNTVQVSPRRLYRG